MITVHSRETNGKKGEWTFHSIYVDGMEGGEYREKEYAQNFLDVNKTEERVEYKVKVTKDE